MRRLTIALIMGMLAAIVPSAYAAEGTLQSRIDQARPGSEIVVRGVQRGPIVVRKPLRIAGTPGAVIDGGGSGTIVRIEAPGVALSRLTLRRSGRDLNTEDAGVFIGAPGALLEDLVLEDVLFGLNLKRAHGARIRRVSVRGYDLPLSRRGDGVRLWYSHGVTLSHLRLDRVRDVLLWFAQGSVLHALEVRGSRYGVHLMYADATRLLDGHFEGNAVGAYVMYSTGVRVEGNRFLRHRGTTGVGLAFKESDNVLIRSNLLAGNHVGLYLDGTPRALTSTSEILDNVIAGNETGMHLLSSASRNVIAGNILDGNALQVRIDGGPAGANTWARGGRGNYWSDYAGMDLRRDGIGDAPYRARQWFEALGDRIPELGLLRGSTAVAAVDFATRVLPLFAPQVLVEDTHPLMRAAVPAVFRGGGPSLSFALTSLCLIVAGLAALAGARPRPRRVPA